MKKKCKIKGCQKISKARRLCNTHYENEKRKGRLEKHELETHKHGLGNTRIYRIYRGMMARCFNKTHPYYSLYGGRGITVCKEWAESVLTFYKDMGESYRESLTLDRIDGNGDYSKENCRWVTHEENSQNARTCKLDANKIREIRDSSETNAELGKKYGVSYKHIWKIRKRLEWKNVT